VALTPAGVASAALQRLFLVERRIESF
jgi:hypothetical protein